MSSTSSSSQYIYPPSPFPPPSPSPSSDLDSLPDSAPSDDTTSTSDDEGESDAEKEWKESLQQLELILTMVLVPYAGKYFGRKCAYWGWAKFMQWKYPVEVVFTSKKTFKAAGAVEAAASL
ncbi:hypothetical protein HO133_005654 [Letharia lupina]|uniref:Uncharacterized protein n=1 Tax=Letharia lupina TaxID=560253 RepID=A0A8H6C7D2_9LECA|nr:uncharacterized protein HO133_005654 [Letharia lupina]KAF6218308.1 hypothetical protein HO133_005654 [Letharia lupina]